MIKNAITLGAKRIDDYALLLLILFVLTEKTQSYLHCTYSLTIRHSTYSTYNTIKYNTIFNLLLANLTLQRYAYPIKQCKNLQYYQFLLIHFSSRENEGTGRDIESVDWDMSIPLKLFLVLDGNESLFPQTST